jgi:hypothetical protein
MLCGEFVATAEVTATVAVYVPTARTALGCNVSVAGAAVLPRFAVSQPEPEVYVIGALNPVSDPPPPFVMVTCWDAGTPRFVDVLNAAVVFESEIVVGGGAAVTV